MTQTFTETARRTERYSVEFPGRVKSFGAAKSRPVTCSDFSAVGCQLTPADDLRTGVQILVKLPGLKFLPATVLWKRLDRVGVEFKHSLHPLAVEEFSRSLGALETPPAA